MKFDPLPTFKPVDKLDGEWIVFQMRVKEPWLFIGEVWRDLPAGHRRTMFDYLMAHVNVAKTGGEWHGKMRKGMSELVTWPEFWTRRAYVRFMIGDKSYGYKFPPPDINAAAMTLNGMAPVLEDGAAEKIRELITGISKELQVWRDGGAKPDWMSLRLHINDVAKELNGITIIEPVEKDEIYDDIFDDAVFGSRR